MEEREYAAALVRRSDRAELEWRAHAAVIDAWMKTPVQEDPEQSAITLATLAVQAVLDVIDGLDLRAPRDRVHPSAG